MVGAIGADYGASAMMNSLLRGLGGTRTAARPTGKDEVGPASESQASAGKSELTEEERQQVEELKKRDAEVRRHEAAHKAAAGQYAKGGAQFDYTRGPDGRQYASGGEVQIDTSEISDDPQATIRKMQQIRRAAAAPAAPSDQDRQVAAQAARLEAQARAELAKSGTGFTEETGVADHAASAPRQSLASAADPSGGAATRPFVRSRAPGVFIDVSA